MNKLLLLSFLLLQNFAATNSHAQLSFIKKLCSKIFYGSSKASDEVAKAAKKAADACDSVIVDVTKLITSRGVKNLTDEAIAKATNILAKNGTKITKEQLKDSYASIIKVVDSYTPGRGDKLKNWAIRINSSASPGSIWPSFTSESLNSAKHIIEITGARFSRFTNMTDEAGAVINTTETYTQSLEGIKVTARILNAAGDFITTQTFWVKYADDGTSNIQIIPVFSNFTMNSNNPAYKAIRSITAEFTY